MVSPVSLRVCVYDRAELERRPLSGDGAWARFKEFWNARALGLAWVLGALLFQKLGRFDHVRGVRSWQELEGFLSALPKRSVLRLEYWGHGAPGAVLCGGIALNTDALHVTEANGLQGTVRELWRVMRADGLVWWRTCATFSGPPGQAFARAFTNETGCRHAGHTHNIGFPWHSGLHTHPPDAQPSWPPDEGNDGERSVGSHRGAPNTIRTWDADVPHGW